MDRLNESIENFIRIEDDDDEANKDLEESENKNNNKLEYDLDQRQVELLNVISNYIDFYDPNVHIQFDARNKFVYTMHALNHALK